MSALEPWMGAFMAVRSAAPTKWEVRGAPAPQCAAKPPLKFLQSKPSASVPISVCPFTPEISPNAAAFVPVEHSLWMRKP
jgi:hypothetical protein